jgi:hypothetical protein
MNDIHSLKKEIEALKARNRRVELDKAWETSTFRKVLVALLTYVMMVITMSIIKVTDPFLSAIIPTIGFLLSTLSIGIVKRLWINKNSY